MRPDTNHREVRHAGPIFTITKDHGTSHPVQEWGRYDGGLWYIHWDTGVRWTAWNPQRLADRIEAIALKEAWGDWVFDISGVPLIVGENPLAGLDMDALYGKTGALVS